MNLIVIISFSILLLSFYYLLLKNTVFGLSPRTGNYVGFFMFYNLIMFIIPSSIFLNLFPITGFWVAFKVEQESVFWITYLILISMFLFFLALKIISITSKNYLYLRKIDTNVNKYNIKFFMWFTTSICLLTIIFVWIFMGVGHSFSLAITNDLSLSTIRSELKANSSIKGLRHLFILIVPFLSAILASNVYKNNNIERTILFIIILTISTWGGSKGPVLTMFIVYFISYSTFNNLKINLKLFFQLLMFILLLLFLVYNIVLLQYSHMTDISVFLDYFYQRVFIAQMIGVYEEFNLWIHNIEYIWHGVPFASSFVDYSIFHKDLMMISEDRTDPSTIGIKNTLFIAEAYAMGGWLLVLVSPIWIALNMTLTYIFIVYIMNKLVFNSLEYTKRIVAIALFSYISITGGFSDLMFFKITIMITILLSPFLLSFYFLKNLKQIKEQK